MERKINSIPKLDENIVDLRDVLTLKDDFIPANKVYNLIKNVNTEIEPFDYTVLMYIIQILNKYDEDNNLSIAEECLKYTAPLTQIESLKILAIGKETRASWMPSLKREPKKESVD